MPIAMRIGSISQAQTAINGSSVLARIAPMQGPRPLDADAELVGLSMQRQHHAQP